MRCIFPDLEIGPAKAVGWFSQGVVLGQRDYEKLPVRGGDAGATVTLIAWPKSGLQANYVVVRDKPRARAYLHTAFPAATEVLNRIGAAQATPPRSLKRELSI